MITSKLSRLGLAALLVSGSCLPALAQDVDGGFYGRVFGGASSLSDTDLSGATSGSVGFGTGQIFGAAIGYDYGASPFRSEFEFAYRTGEANGSSGVTGDFASTTLALNGYYDFSFGRVTPYLGAGLAYITEIDFDLVGGGATGEYSDRGAIGYQIMAGASYAISENWSLDGELRYFDAGSQDLSGSGGSISAGYSTVDFIIGTSFRF